MFAAPHLRSIALGTGLAMLAATAPSSAADALPELGDRPRLTIGIGVVPLSLHLPDIAFDAIDLGQPIAPADGTAEGIGFAIGVSAEVGSLGGVPLFVEASAAFARADNGTRTVAPLLTGSAFALNAGDATGETLDLDAMVDPSGASASAVVTVTDPTGSTATVDVDTASPPGPNQTNLLAVSRTAGGGVALASATTDAAGSSATAIGFAGDAEGFVFRARGDLSDVRILSASEQSVDYTELELRFAGAVPLRGSGWVAVPSLAPAYRHLGRDVATRLAIELPADPLSGVRGAVSFDTVDRLSAHYVGGSVGLGAVGPVPGGLVLSVGASAGLLGMFADLDATTALSVRGPARASTVLSADATADRSELAHFVRANVGVTRPLGGASLSFGGQVEYLSDVPVARRAPGASGFGAGFGRNGAVRIETDDALIASGSLSLTFAF